ncbi:YhgE/Pip domain-containing protein [Mammaliicoccus sciuri]|uniref:YhgE/Pip domain-containing protein n=1 Tax=Mammaliicoccus sciuri TaxID=1296 RepID=UPI002885FA69|nr:YhgE/Pip domain-containing protein [Mammaliicoccus sciuri]MDT0696019.1 YhgE/Pip domain-containing protein [Mammaliicoccus sciuri]
MILKKPFEIFIEDIKNIRRVPFVIILLLGLSILPSFYAWFNLSSTWDPYNNTQGIKIAVVNEDKGAKVEDKDINVGDQLVEQLKKNDKFGWEFVNRKKADDGVEKGDYYASIYLHKTFSDEVTSIYHKKPKKAVIDYKVNEKLNAIAPKMTNAGASSIVDSLNKEFGENATQALLKEANQVGLDLENELPTLSKIKNAVYTAEDNLPKIEEFKEKVIEIDEHQDDITKYKDEFEALGNYKGDINEGVTKINEVNSKMGDINQAAQLITKLNAKMPEIESALAKANKIQQQFPKINKGVPQGIEATEKALAAINKAEQYLPELNRKLDRYEADAKKAQEKTEKANEKLKSEAEKDKKDTKDNKAKPEQSTEEPQQSSEENNEDNNTDQNAEEQESDKEQSDDTSKEETEEKPSTEEQEKDNNIVTTQQAYEEENDNNENNDQASKNVLTDQELNEMKSALSESLTALADYSNEQATMNKKDLESMQAINQSILMSQDSKQLTDTVKNNQSRLQQGVAFNDSMIDILKELQKSEGIDTSSAISQFESANKDLQSVINGQSNLINALNNGKSGKEEVLALDKLIDSNLVSLDNLLKYTSSDFKTTLMEGVNQIDQALTKGIDDISKIRSSMNMIDNVIQTGKSSLQNGHDLLVSINNELPELERKFNNINEVAQTNFPKFKEQVGKGAYYVENELPNVQSEVKKLAQFSNNDLPTMIDKYDRAVQLIDDNLPEAQKEIHDLAEFARNDLPSIEEDIKKAAKKVREIDKDDTVHELIKLLKNDLKKQADIIAHPIELKEESLFSVPNYGTASTPFYTSLAIWVGALLLSNLLTTDIKNQEIKQKYSLRETFVGKSFIFIIIGVIQSIIVSLGDMFILGAAIDNRLLFILLSVLVSIVFISIVYTLVSLFGNVGKALAIVIMVLQIAGGGGTFPIQVTPKFFQAIHPYLPFTYAVDALREAVGGVVPEILIYNLICLVLFGVVIFTIGFIVKPILDPWKKKTIKRAEDSYLME